MRDGFRWLVESFQPLQFEAASIYSKICPTHGIPCNDCFTAFKKALKDSIDNASDTNNPLNKSLVFKDALEVLPQIARRIKALPKSEIGALQIVQESEVRALNAFIVSSKLGVNWIVMCKISLACDSVTPTYKMRPNKEIEKQEVERAMLDSFKKAYAWWHNGSKAENAFRESVMSMERNWR
jgi:hypothetical protein